jgi:hypothetical protein
MTKFLTAFAAALVWSLSAQADGCSAEERANAEKMPKKIIEASLGVEVESVELGISLDPLTALHGLTSGPTNAISSGCVMAHSVIIRTKNAISMECQLIYDRSWAIQETRPYALSSCKIWNSTTPNGTKVFLLELTN